MSEPDQTPEIEMSAADRQAWAAPTDLRGLGEVCARWLTGDGVASQPAYLPETGPDPETRPLIGTLAGINRIGYFTTDSQPGLISDDGGAGGRRLLQRAAVTGFASEELAEWLTVFAERAGLLLVIGKLGEGDDAVSGAPIDVTYVGAEACTWFGELLTRVDIGDPDCGYGICSQAAQDALGDAWQITLVDPFPGRDDALWKALNALHTLYRLQGM